MQSSLVVVCAALMLAAANALPAYERYMWMPDGDGNLHLVDLLETEPNPRAFNGASDVTLNLYTRSNPTSAQILKLNDASSGSNFNKNNPTRFMIHGWNSAASNMDHVRKAYIDTGSNYNIIMVDWSKAANTLYSTAKTNSRLVGEYLAQVINWLISSRQLNVNTLYIIGHSLGAHAAGVAGDRIGSIAARVVGLDAAAPLFGSESLPNRIDATDAKFVEGIHTNGGTLGWTDPYADADFYPNGGSSQSGCGVDLAGACSHSRSHEYYAESINSNKFVGTRCTNYSTYNKGGCNGNPTAVMGEQTSTSASGSYFLNTNSKSPFAQG